MAVAVCHFNWCGYTTPTRNLFRFIRQMAATHIPVYGVELSLTDNFVTNGMKRWKQITVKKENICFQQYACINLLEKIIPNKYTKIAWIDHDVFFMNPNWYDEASISLETNKLVQLFDCYISTGIDGREINRKKSCIKYPKTLKTGPRNGKTGVAWAARRDLWTVGGGLYPYSVMGGGDTIFLFSAYDNPTVQDEWKTFVPINGNRFLNWKRKFISYVNEQCSCISGKVVHEWHGDLPNKKYGARHEILLGLDLENVITLNDQGIIEFRGVSDEFLESVLMYFNTRQEDGELILTKGTEHIL